MNNFEATFNNLNSTELVSEKYTGSSPRGFQNKLWICKNKDGFPIILLKSSKEFPFIHPKEISKIKLQHHIAKNIISKKKELNIYCSELICKTRDEKLISLFFDSVINIFKNFTFPVDPKVLSDTTERLITLFESLEEPNKKSIQGLWSELFLILYSKDPCFLLDCWHEDNKALYDFENGNFFIEAKSTTALNRKHRFTISQATVKPTRKVLLASFKLEEDELGLSLQEIYKRSLKIFHDDVERKEKLDFVIRSTLGKDWKAKSKIAYNYEKAIAELAFFDLDEIPKVGKEYKEKPNLENISFTSVLDNLPQIKKLVFKKKSKLFNKVF